MLPPVNNGGGDAEAVPALYEGPEGRPGPMMYTLEVDGQLFAVRRAHDGRGTDYDWVNGPNKDYGFGSSANADQPVEEHRKNIRNFLSMIDPVTGYIAED